MPAFWWISDTGTELKWSFTELSDKSKRFAVAAGRTPADSNINEINTPFTRCNRLSNRLFNRFNNRLQRVNGVR